MSFNKYLETAKNSSIMGTEEKCLKKIQSYVEIEVTYFIFSLTDPIKDKESLKFFAKL